MLQELLSRHTTYSTLLYCISFLSFLLLLPVALSFPVFFLPTGPWYSLTGGAAPGIIICLQQTRGPDFTAISCWSVVCSHKQPHFKPENYHLYCYYHYYYHYYHHYLTVIHGNFEYFCVFFTSPNSSQKGRGSTAETLLVETFIVLE